MNPSANPSATVPITRVPTASLGPRIARHLLVAGDERRTACGIRVTESWDLSLSKYEDVECAQCREVERAGGKR